MGKLATPEWILKGFDSKEDFEKANGVKAKKKKESKTFKVRECPKCSSDEVAVVLGEEEGRGKGEWECKKCGWKGKNINEKELNEDEFMKYLDEKGEEVA